MREAAVVAVLTVALAGCGGRTDLSVRETADGAAGSGGVTLFTGAGGVRTASGGSPEGGARAASGGSPEGGTPSCVPRDLGGRFGIPAVEGVLAGESAYSSCGTGPETWFHWKAPTTGSWIFDALGSDGNVSVTALDGSRECATFPRASCGTAGKATVVRLERGQVLTIVVDTNARTSGYSLSISGPIGGGDGCPDIDVGTKLGTVRVGRLDRDATFQTNFGCGGGLSFTVVTAWTAPSSGNFDFDTRGSSFDTLLEVREGCGGDARIYGCSDDYRGTDARLGLFFEEGTRVNVLLGGKAVVRPEEDDFALSIAER